MNDLNVTRESIKYLKNQFLRKSIGSISNVGQELEKIPQTEMDLNFKTKTAIYNTTKNNFVKYIDNKENKIH